MEARLMLVVMATAVLLAVHHHEAIGVVLVAVNGYYAALRRVGR